MTDLDVLQQTGDAEPNDLIMTIIIIIAFSILQYPSNTGFYKYDCALTRIVEWNIICVNIRAKDTSIGRGFGNEYVTQS